MPNRIIKDSIRTSRSVNQMSDFQFRLWTYLITYVDDYGRGSADPELLKGFIFPRRKSVTEDNIKKALLELACIGSVNLYVVDGEPYLYFPGWSEHQRIQQKKSKYPAVDEGRVIDVVNGESPWVTVSHRMSPPESNPIQSNPNKNPNPNPNTNSLANARGKRTRTCEEKGNAAGKKAYGEYGNVYLTDAEYAELKSSNADTDEAIEILSEYIKRKGYRADDHFLTIKKWVYDAVRERREKAQKSSVHPKGCGSSFDTDDAFEAAMKRSFIDDNSIKKR